MENDPTAEPGKARAEKSNSAHENTSTLARYPLYLQRRYKLNPDTIRVIWRNSMGFRNPAVLMILILLIVLLFGASKLPDITRQVGRSLKIFKEEVRDLSDDGSSQTIEGSTSASASQEEAAKPTASDPSDGDNPPYAPNPPSVRSEERRVGKEGRDA